MADIERGVRLHYLDSARAERTAILIHGFPQTAHEWTKVAPALIDAGLRVVAPDYRGAGSSSKPATGYDKRTMAQDIHRLAREHLKVAGPVALVGHDIGAMVAAAYALRYRDEVSHLMLLDAPLPGTSAFDRMRGDPRGWHAAFHSARDVAEMLVQGRERAYLQQMIDVRIFDPSAITPEDFDTYVRAYEAPGAGLAQVMPDMVREIADRAEHVTAPRSGHWIPEENPAFVADALLKLIADTVLQGESP